jgi:hypothetical protein
MSRPGARLFVCLATIALLAGCGRFEPSPKPGVSVLPDPSLAATASRPADDTTLTPGCFLTTAEVEEATGKTLARPPEGSTGPKGDQSCQYYLGGAVPVGGFGCNCLATNGPFDLQGQGTAWLDPLRPGAEIVSDVGDGATLLNGSNGGDFWAVNDQTGIHISISYQFLTAEQFATLANAAFDRIAAGT